MTGRDIPFWVDMLNQENHLLMKVMNNPDINEFQYTVEGNDWIIHLK